MSNHISLPENQILSRNLVSTLALQKSTPSTTIINIRFINRGLNSQGQGACFTCLNDFAFKSYSKGQAVFHLDFPQNQNGCSEAPAKPQHYDYCKFFLEGNSGQSKSPIVHSHHSGQFCYRAQVILSSLMDPEPRY